MVNESFSGALCCLQGVEVEQQRTGTTDLAFDFLTDRWFYMWVHQWNGINKILELFLLSLHKGHLSSGEDDPRWGSGSWMCLKRQVPFAPRSLERLSTHSWLGGQAVLKMWNAILKTFQNCLFCPILATNWLVWEASEEDYPKDRGELFPGHIWGASSLTFYLEVPFRWAITLLSWLLSWPASWECILVLFGRSMHPAETTYFLS